MTTPHSHPWAYIGAALGGIGYLVIVLGTVPTLRSVRREICAAAYATQRTHADSLRLAVADTLCPMPARR